MLTHLLTFALLADSIRLWRRAVSYPRLGPRTDHAQPPALLNEYVLLSAPGISVPEHVHWRAAQWADDEGVLVVDLLPEGWSGLDAIAQLNKVHPFDYSLKPFVAGISAGVAVLVHERVLQRVAPPEAREGYEAWLTFTHSLKRFAPWESALVVATDWRQARPQLLSQDERHASLSALYGPQLGFIRWLSPVMWLWVGCSVWSEPGLYGLLIALLWLAQPAFILATSPLKAAWLPLSLARPFLDVKRWLELLPIQGRSKQALRTALRDSYQEEIQRGEGLDRGEGLYFQAERDTCPLCDSAQLVPHMAVPDFYQGKPGLFRLHRCGDCEHIFQNPQLSIEGLQFYYQDFYDGLGEEGMDMIFGASEQSYRQRVSMIRSHGAPERWLDVGGGHGHFTLIAKHLMPQTRFELLDLSESVDLAVERGWCDGGLRGLFPAQADELKAQYDGVSMSHYLEHTTDPISELDAARCVLKEGGLIMIEVPDPASVLGRTLKSFWLPWFQPQHLHFMSVENLGRSLEERGFEVLEVDREEAHQSVDFFFAVMILLQRLAPDRAQPWATPATPLYQVGRGLLLLCALPLIALAFCLDHALRPLFTRPGWSNTYRMIAQKVSSGEDSERSS